MNVEENLNMEMDELESHFTHYDTTPIDPFYNLLGAMQQQSPRGNNQRLYMTQLNAYLRSAKQWRYELLNAQAEGLYYKKIKIFVENKGRTASTNINLELSFDTFVPLYDKSALTVKHGEHLEPPANYANTDGVTIPPALVTKQHEIVTWDSSKKLRSPIRINIPQINPKETIEVEQEFFIHAGFAKDYNINWSMSSTETETKNGTIIIRVN